MVHQTNLAHHHLKRKGISIDNIVYLAVFIGPLVNIPQLLKVWIEHSVTGVSILTWAGLASISLLWLWYGVYHKEKPLIIMNAALLAFQIFILLGVLLYK